MVNRLDVYSAPAAMYPEPRDAAGLRRLSRRSFLPGEAAMIMINNALREQYPTENIMLERNYRPTASHLIPTPPSAPTMNGQLVDTLTHLMCSRCSRWQPDDAFYMDKSRIVRRERCYYCKDCMDASRLYRREAACAAQERPARHRKKRRKH
jgi:hypothetical protein